MITYVLGFLFSADGESVALVKKNRPSWMAGKLNGVGGKIEQGEARDAAMEREFFEETGVIIPARRWEHFMTLSGEGAGWIVFCFRAFDDKVFSVRTAEDEVVRHCKVSRVFENDTMHNLPWLIPMALSRKVTGFAMEGK